jgi:hypothetical protein
LLVLGESGSGGTGKSDVGALKLSSAEIIAGSGTDQTAAAVTSSNGADKANARADITTAATPDAANVAAAATTTAGVVTITAEDDTTGNTFTSASKITSDTNA